MAILHRQWRFASPILLLLFRRRGVEHRRVGSATVGNDRRFFRECGYQRVVSARVATAARWQRLVMRVDSASRKSVGRNRFRFTISSIRRAY